jgi:hypothetical protein
MYYQSDDDSDSLAYSSDSDTIGTAPLSDSESDSDNGEVDILSLTSNSSIIIEFDQYSDSSNDDNVINEIFRKEQLHLDSPKQSGRYYIGLHKYIKYDKVLLMLNSISMKTFYKYAYIHVLKYLYYYSIARLYHPNIEIMKLSVLEDGTYSVVLKTHWLRLVQRHWRKAFNLRKEMMKKQMLVSSILYREIYGRFPSDICVLPRLDGLMSQYATYKKSSNIRID